MGLWNVTQIFMSQNPLNEWNFVLLPESSPLKWTSCRASVLKCSEKKLNWKLCNKKKHWLQKAIQCNGDGSTLAKTPEKIPLVSIVPWKQLTIPSLLIKWKWLLLAFMTPLPYKLFSVWLLLSARTTLHYAERGKLLSVSRTHTERCFRSHRISWIFRILLNVVFHWTTGYLKNCLWGQIYWRDLKCFWEEEIN